jgi:hypothetical protein
MSETETKAAATTHWVYRALAVLLTIAIVVVVFWQAHPNGEQGGDGTSSPTGDRFNNRQTGDIEAIAPDSWRVYSEPMFVIVNGNPATSFEYRMRMFNMMDDDTRTLTRAYRTLMFDSSVAQSIGMSQDQIAAIQKIDFPRAVPADEPRQKFESLWHEWESADASKKPAAREAVLSAMRDLARQSVDPTKRAWADAAGQIRKTLTLQQMAKLAVYEDEHGTGMGGPWGGWPSSRPMR